MATQRRYGGKNEDLAAVITGFEWALRGVPIQQIIDAIREHARQSPEMPTPADVMRIINPPEPELSAAMYMQLNRQRAAGAFITDDEWRFIRRFEKNQLSKIDRWENKNDAIKKMAALETGLPVAQISYDVEA